MLPNKDCPNSMSITTTKYQNGRLAWKDRFDTILGSKHPSFQTGRIQFRNWASANVGPGIYKVYLKCEYKGKRCKQCSWWCLCTLFHNHSHRESLMKISKDSSPKCYTSLGYKSKMSHSVDRSPWGSIPRTCAHSTSQIHGTSICLLVGTISVTCDMTLRQDSLNIFMPQCYFPQKFWILISCVPTINVMFPTH